MSQLIITQRDFDQGQVSINVTHKTVTWAQNLVTGFTHLLIHFLTPLNDYGFEFDCLFTNNQFCKQSRLIIANEPPHSRIQQKTSESFPQRAIAYVGYQLKSKLGELIRSLSLGQTIEARKSTTNYRETTPTKYYSHLLTVQLIACTIVICIYLYRDLRFIMINRKCYKSNRLH